MLAENLERQLDELAAMQAMYEVQCKPTTTKSSDCALPQSR